MIKIVGNNVIDLISYQQGILFVLKEPAADGQIKVSYYSFDIQSQSIAAVTKNAYLMTKFGPGYATIVSHLDDYVSCEAQRISDGRTFVIYPGGEIGIFSDSGELLHTQLLTYKDTAIRSLAYDGTNLWLAAPKANAVIRYNTAKNRIDLRLGDIQAGTFSYPICVSQYNDSLFVCCKNTNAIQEIALKEFTVKTYQSFQESVLQYLRIDKGEVVVLRSGVYLL